MKAFDPLFRVAVVTLLLSALCAVAGGEGADVATRATIREDGVLLVDDEPVFPVGMHTEQVASLEPIAQAGFNLASGTGEWDEGHYAAARDRGLLILGGHYVWASFASFRKGGGIDLKPSEAAGLTNVLKRGRDQSWRYPLDTLKAFDHLPGVIGWRTNEEPEAKLTEYLEYAYEIFKSHSPAHLVVTLSCDPRWFGAFRNTADVLVVDNYPFRGGRGPKRSVLETYEWVRQGVEAMKGKAVWVMPQLIPPSYWSLNPEDEVTVRQMRLQNYAGLIAGAKGIIMYNESMFTRVWFRGDEGKQSRPADEEQVQARWDRVKTVVGEMKTLGSVICSGRATSDLEIRWTEPGALGPGPQMMRELDVYGSKYLLVANTMDVPIEGNVYGINGGNREAYDATVFVGDGDLAVDAQTPGVPRISVAAQGCGAFLLTRRPVQAMPEGQ